MRTKYIISMVVILLLLSVAVVSAQELVYEMSEKIGEVTIYEGQEAIEKYAELKGISIDDARRVIEDSRRKNKEKEGANQKISEQLELPRITANHFSVYVPPCVHPAHGSAFALFETGPGPVNVQFHGNRLWQANRFCGGTNCTFVAEAGLPFPGDEIWAYSVVSAASFDIDHWCAGGITTAGPEDY